MNQWIFYINHGSLPYSNHSAIWCYPEPDESNPIRRILILSVHLPFPPSNWTLPFRLRLKFLVLSFRVTCHSQCLQSMIYKNSIWNFMMRIFMWQNQRNAEVQISVYSSEQPIGFMSVMLCLSTSCFFFYFDLLTNRPCRAVTCSCIAFSVSFYSTDW